jgi:hypothetical protein
VAVTVTAVDLGRSGGAVYRPEVLILPTPVPLTLQLTNVFELPVTMAENCTVLPSSTVELAEDTATVTDCGGGGFEED